MSDCDGGGEGDYDPDCVPDDIEERYCEWHKSCTDCAASDCNECFDAGEDGRDESGQTPIEGPFPFDGIGECNNDVMMHANPFTPQSVSIHTGDKFEALTDLVIPLAGRDFVITRQYTSSPDYDGPDLVGRNWTLSPFRYFKTETSVDGQPLCCSAQMGGGGGGGYTILPCTCPSGSTPSQFEIRGPTAQSFTKTTATVVYGGTTRTWPVWRLLEPGQWEIDFFRDKETGDGSADDPPEQFHGLIAEARDLYAGNRHTYYWSVFGSDEENAARLVRIELNRQSTTTNPEARVEFLWNFFAGGANTGRLWGIRAYRCNYEGEDPEDDIWVETHKVMYTYMDTSDAGDPPAEDDNFHSSIGLDGDLVQVVKYTRVDPKVPSLAAGSPIHTVTWREQVTQYRYHIASNNETSDDPEFGGDDDGFIEKGNDHQLKMVIMPEQIEFALQKYGEDDEAPEFYTSVPSFAFDLLRLADGDVVYPDGIEDVIVSQLAAKVVEEYETTGEKRVKTQYVLADCGCGGADSGKKLTYNFLSYTGGRTLKVSEYPWDGTAGSLYRTLYYDTVEYDGSPYLIGWAISDGTNEWVTRHVYDADERTLLRELTPSAFPGSSDYTPSNGSSAPSYSPSSTAGLVWAYSYDGDNRLVETRIGVGLEGSETLSTPADPPTAYTLISKITYFDADGSGTEWDSDDCRDHLVSKVEQYRVAGSSSANDIETTKYFYKFHGDSGNDISCITAKVEAELGAENGPGGEYTSYEVIDTRGNNTWSVAADGSRTKRTYDTDNSSSIGMTGAVMSITRNADGTGFPSADMPGGIPSHRNGDGGSLVTTYTRDNLGRVRSVTTPGGVTTYYRREMRVAPVLDVPSESIFPVKYYCEVMLPHQWDSGSALYYDGPASLTWMNAGGDVIAERTHELEPDDGDGAYGTDEDGAAYKIGISFYKLLTSDYLSRMFAAFTLRGQVSAQHVWHRDSESTDAHYTISYAYDKFGRVETVTNPNGTITENIYDVLDRATEVKVGTSSGNRVTVAKYFYDGDGSDAHGVGNGNVTRVREMVTSTSGDDRITENTHDARDRLTRTKHAEKPLYELFAYDNLDRLTASALFGSPGSAPSAVTDTTARERYSETAYSQRGLAYRQRVKLDPSNGTGDYLESHSWFDETGRVVGQLNPGAPMSKTTFDGLGRVETAYRVAVCQAAGGGACAATVGSGSFEEHYDDSTFSAIVASDVVFEQVDYRYIADEGLLDLVTMRLRTHDAADSELGALSGFTSPDDKLVITSYVANYYNAFDRISKTANYGTNTSSGFAYGGAAPTVTQSSSPDWSDDVLVTQTTYNTRGLVEKVTDPKATTTKYFYDWMNRVVGVAENFVDATVTWSTSLNPDRWDVNNVGPLDDDRVTTYVYDGVGNVTMQVAHLPDSGGSPVTQITAYAYGVDTDTSDNPLASTIVSNDLLGKVVYPEESTSSPAEADRTVWHAYNRQGELITMEDQNDTRHVYARDPRGRVTQDTASNLGSGIDGAVRAMKVAYDNAGRLEKATSYSDTAATTAVNEAKFSYTKLWQVEKVDQDHNGAVTLDGGGSPTGDTRRVSYTYDTQKIVDGQDDNYTRLTQLTYPGPSAHGIDYGYDTGTPGSGAQVSRLMKISSSTPAKVYAEYGYIGLGTFAVVDIDAIDVQLDRTASADGKRNAAGYTTSGGGVYPGFDRFGRVVRHAWLDGDYTTTGGGSPAPTKVSIVEQSYSYDRASNRLTAYDVRPGATTTPGFKYTYDELHRLDKAERGKWDPITGGGTFTLLKNSQDWTLDLLGNWTSVYNDLNGDGTYSPTAERDLRDHNGVNELIERTLKGQGPAAADLVLDPITYDKSGNILDEQRQVGSSTSETTWEYVHDAWNRLVEVKVSGAPDITKARYGYNALKWRITKQVDTDLSGAIDWKSVMYYSANWKLLEERIDSNADATDDSRRQYVWGARYIDDIIHSRLDANIDGDFTDGGDKRYYHLTDVQFSTVALTNDASTRPKVLERVTYSAYGKARHHRYADLTEDGATSGLDLAILNGAWGGAPNPHIADLDRDGDVDGIDLALLNGDWAAAAADGVLSLSTIGNIIGWDGYVFNAESEQYHVRHRVYDPVLGRWLQRDPIQYIDGMSMYEYVAGCPMKYLDALGLHKQDNWHDLPSELKSNREFRKFVECSKEGVELPKGFQYGRRDLWRLVEEWAPDAKLDKSVREKIGRALRELKGGGLLIVGLGIFFLTDDVAASFAEKSSPCRRFLEAIKINARRAECNADQLERLGEDCKWDLMQKVGNTYGNAAAAALQREFDKYLKALRRECENHRCPTEDDGGEGGGGSSGQGGSSACPNTPMS